MRRASILTLVTHRSTLGRLLTIAALSTSAARAQAPAAPKTGAAALEGAWSQVEMFGPNVPWHATQPGQRLFVDGYYSTVVIATPYGAPRPALPDSTGTAEEFNAVLGIVTAQAGTYTVSGDTIIQRVIVAKNPAVMQPSNAPGKPTYRLLGDSLWITAADRSSTTKYVRQRGTDQGALRGVWRQLEVRPVGPNQPVTFNQPGFRMFVDGHWSWVRVNGTSVRPDFSAQATAAEMRAIWGAFTAHGGTYGMAGDVAIQVPQVSLPPAGMARGLFNTFTVRIVGDTLFSTNHGSQAGPATAPSTGKYLRVRNRPPTE